MQEMIIYLLKSAGLISLFYIGYYFLLKNDTGFKANRVFLLFGILTSLLLPSLEITRTIEVPNSVDPFFSEDSSAEILIKPITQQETIDWWQIAGIIYLSGLAFFLIKFIIELFLLLKLISTHKSLKEGNFKIIQRKGIQPFSFFRYIVLDPEQHTPAEQELILKHEKSHARQWHSADQLFTSLSVYLLWFNPLAWLYRRSVVQNLEYLADKEVITAQVSKKEYQKTLLKISVGDFQPALTNQFYQSFIKKRIMMLNKNNDQKSNFWKVIVLLPFLVLFTFVFNTKIIAQTTSEKQESIIYGNASFNEVSEEETSSNKNPGGFLDNIGEKPLFIISGKEYQKDDLNGKTIWIKAEMDVVAASEASESYGNKGKDGVIIISEAEILADYDAHLKQIDSENKAVSRKYIWVMENNKPFFATLVKHEERMIPEANEIIAIQEDNTPLSYLNLQDDRPLFVVNGEVMDKDFKINSINHQNIKSITVLKGESAVEKFGKKGKHGVIEIFLKTKEELENIKVGAEKSEKEADGKKSVTFTAQKVKFEESEQKEGTGVTITGVESAKFADKDVLYVVDGKVMEKDFEPKSIGPENIESITIFKGDKATAKYGEKAANGVVEISTKK